jgi:mannose-6-phosphate isomerase-like protein (cupin superfamily)
VQCAPDHRGARRAAIDQDFILNPGDVLLQPANVPDSAANNGSEPLVLLVVDIFPSAGVATPTA